MHKIAAFSQEESALIDKADEILKQTGKDIYSTFINQKQSLKIFALLVSKTPSLKSKERYGMDRRDISTMAETISVTGSFNPLLLPTRATMGRSFILTKINFFYFLLKVLSTNKTEILLVKNIQQICDRMVFSLMAEEAYEAIIKNNLTGRRISRFAADELSHLWEFRMDRNLDAFSPPLMSLWRERCRAVPVLGTLQGTVELLKLSINLPDIWGDFLSSASDNPGMEPALEEFIFGLRYEEIRHLREIISSLESPVIDRKKAVEILIKEKIYEEKQEIFLTGDAREIYSFFHTRLENAAKRELAEIEGPRQTIEELFLIYLLEKKRNVFPSGLKDSFSRFFGAFSRTV